MMDDGLLVVSAKTRERKEKLKYHFNVVAGGMVKSPFTFTDSVVRRFEDLTKVDSSFREVKEIKDQLYLHLVALGFHARMYLKMTEQKHDKGTRWDFECVEGSFKGMTGSIQVQEIERHRTEVAITSDYFSEKSPLPKAIIGFGVEIITRQVAEKMRTYIHSEAKKKGYYFEETN